MVMKINQCVNVKLGVKSVDNKSVTFIVALRGREGYIPGFIENVSNIYNDYKIIFVIQNDDLPFNKTALYNLVFKYCKTEILVFCDVDIRMKNAIDFIKLFNNLEKPFVPYLTTYNIVNNLPINSNNYFSKRILCTSRELFIKYDGFNGVLSNAVRTEGSVNHIFHKPFKNETIYSGTIKTTKGNIVFSEITDKISCYSFNNIIIEDIINKIPVKTEAPLIRNLFSDIIDGVKKNITFNIATYPKREKALEQCLNILLNINSIDLIRVYLNEYKSVPKCCLNNKIKYVLGKENLKDTGKYFWAGNYKDEYYFTLDDDLGINEEYIENHLELLKKYLNSIFVTLHGKILNKNPKTFRDYTSPIACLKPHPNNTYINFPGTGVSVFDNSRFIIDYKIFEYHGMADLWIAKLLQGWKTPCIVRKHKFEVNALCNDNNESLYGQRRLLHENHVKILNSVDNWELYTEFDYIPTKIEYDYCININSYNRYEMLNDLIEQINLNTKYKILINIFDDCSQDKELYAKIANKFHNVVLYRFSENHGKNKYWEIYDTIFKICKNINAKYFIFLPDDVSLKNNFIKKATDLYDNINDNNKVCMSVLIDELRKWKPCWTNFIPIQLGSVYKTQWNDLCFISEKTLMEKLDYKIENISEIRFNKKNISSGVGQQISQKLHDLGLSMYHSKNSLVIHGNHESKMNKEERKKHKLIAK